MLDVVVVPTPTVTGFTTDKIPVPLPSLFGTSVKYTVSGSFKTLNPVDLIL